MNRIRRLLKQLAPIQEMADKAFADQEAEYQAAKEKREREQQDLLRESRERQRGLQRRP